MTIVAEYRPAMRRNVALLSAAQAILGAQLPMIFVVAGLIGSQIAPSPTLATLPITCLVAGSMFAATPLSAFMHRYGRRLGFIAGALAGALGAAVSATGLVTQSFAVFCAGSVISGFYQSAQGFYRFGASDSAPRELRSRAISYVLAGGLASAILGPQLVKLTHDWGAVPFLGTYLAVIALNLLGSALFLPLEIPRPTPPMAYAAPGRSRRELLRTPVIAVAILSAAVAYAMMNLSMTATPLAMVGCGFSTSAAADVVSAHVLAMFVPSFFTGHLIARFGTQRIMGLGLALLAGSGATALSGIELGHFYVALILLGLGWNFAFIGATTLLTEAETEADKGRLQGMNDMIVMGSVTVASLVSGGLMNAGGVSAEDGWTAVNLAMVPALTLAGGALIWLTFKRGRTA